MRLMYGKTGSGPPELPFIGRKSVRSFVSVIECPPLDRRLSLHIFAIYDPGHLQRMVAHDLHHITSPPSGAATPCHVQLVVATREPFFPAGYRFYERYDLPVATSSGYFCKPCRLIWFFWAYAFFYALLWDHLIEIQPRPR
ncbi:hypothetical protein EVAR_45428_1 [Eumeta japonica]|uniref:Uncharacterized protein n=1 Tax=Eumeta variegata TaxID=151549 RepID=A0A4C1ZIS5_EUMVA|nr:hypothetical protein EVAR_45428_1 [Eumeta japonica]